MSDKPNPFGGFKPAAPGTSTFGGGFGKPDAPASTPTAPAFGSSPASPPAATPSSSPQPGRRRQVAESGPAIDSGVSAPSGDSDKRYAKVDGFHYCHLDIFETNKKGEPKIVLAIVGGPLAGAKPTLNLAKNAQRVRSFFKDSGYPDTSWPRDANGKPQLPVMPMFLRTVMGEDGSTLQVPILMLGKFSLGENKQNVADPFQNIDFCRPVRIAYEENGKPCESLVIAPLPGFLPPQVGAALGWRGDISQFGSFQVDRQAMRGVDQVYGQRYQPLDGHSADEIDISTPAEVIR